MFYCYQNRLVFFIFYVEKLWLSLARLAQECHGNEEEKRQYIFFNTAQWEVKKKVE